MSNFNVDEDIVSRLASQADAVARLAQDSGGFAAVAAAFEAKDANAFSWVLERLELLPYCELICEWVRIKFGVLRCTEICGPPREDSPRPSLQQFAKAVVDLSSNEKLLRRVVDAVACGDRDAYQSAVGELKLNDYCYLLCHWVYSIISYGACEVLCSPGSVYVPDAASEVLAAGKAISKLMEDQKAIDTIAAAAVDVNCETLQSSLTAAGVVTQCEIVCRWICSWRYSWVCREVCRYGGPVVAEAQGVEEARSFALALRPLSRQARALGDLVTAAKTRDADVFSALVARFGLEEYCVQVCAWVSSVICYEFCTCVCPPQETHPPLFTNVGNFNIYSDIDPTSGLTDISLPHTSAMPRGGGPNFAFYNCLTLSGFCPTYSPAFPGVQMKYRLLYSASATTLAAAITATQTSITVTSGVVVPATPFTVAVCGNCSTDGEPVEMLTVNSVSGTTWTVVRGEGGTTPVAAGAGATVAIDPTPINGNLVCPVQVGTQWISWPTRDLAGNATSTYTSQEQPVWVVPPVASPPFTPPADPTPPAASTPWYPPQHNLTPDANGWIPVDEQFIAGSAGVFLGFDTTQPGVAPGGDPIPDPIGTPGGAPAGTAVSSAGQKVGTNLSIIFQATRTTVTTVDYSNALCTIRVNNWSEVNNLWFLEFDGPGGCCTPITSDLAVQFTVDHEVMNPDWSLGISSCALSPSIDLTPTASVPAASTTLAAMITATQTTITVASSAGFPSAPFNLTVSGTGETIIVNSVAGTTWTVVRGEGGTAAPAPLGTTVSYPGVTDTTRGGSGTIVENTSGWTNCSYTVGLTTWPLLTTGLYDRLATPLTLTFCICGHDS